MGHFGGTNPDIPRREFGTKLSRRVADRPVTAKWHAGLRLEEQLPVFKVSLYVHRLLYTRALVAKDPGLLLP
jgi:hypothetical protein